MRNLTRAAVATLLAFGLAGQVQAQDFPSKPVRILVPYAPGGVVDVAARIVAHALSERWPHQVVVENRPGGRGYLATGLAAKAPPDGYTMLMAHTGEFAVNPVIFKDVPYDFERDFQAITMVSDAPIVIGAWAKSPYKTLQDLIADARKRPGEIAMATPGVGTINYLVGAWLELEAGVRFLHVPYKGGAPSAAAAASGEVPFGIAALSSTQPQIDAGLVRVLAVSTNKRTHVNMSWPTIQEAGVKNVESSIWTGLFVQKGVPKAIVDKIYQDVAAVLKTKAVQDRFYKGGASTGGMTPAEFTAKIVAETEHFRSIVKKAGVKAP